MPRFVPTVDGTPSFKRVSFRYIDQTGDMRGDSLVIDNATTDAEIETAVGLLGAATKANLYAVEVTDVYEGADSPTVALGGQRNSVYSNIVGLVRNTLSRFTQNFFVPAPVDTLFVPETDDPDIDAAGPLYNLTDAMTALIGPNNASRSLRYTERREINQRKKL